MNYVEDNCLLYNYSYTNISSFLCFSYELKFAPLKVIVS